LNLPGEGEGDTSTWNLSGIGVEVEAMEAVTDGPE
jgi:hypothetical protein